ncbi:peptidoglycan-binding domain-containing protein [uncultured Paraglaciecola sp.]|uniref:peptidoglycan-binding domain-containing protein n=1 Tax=uncultured Paraglaciecola sp. TaxID=1765024 RepID=UPI002627EEA4|nr:peptidoglycan-binding domain-containing protein [uncultured Paraglaciecola sp.]
MFKNILSFCCLLVSSTSIAVQHADLHQKYLQALKQQPETDVLLQKALSLERQAFELSPTVFKYAFNIGVVYSYLNDHQASENWFVTALKIAQTDSHRESAIAALDNTKLELARIATNSWQPSVNVSMVLKSGAIELQGNKKAMLPKALGRHIVGQPVAKRIQPVKAYFRQFDRFSTENVLILSNRRGRSANEHFRRGFKDFYAWYKKQYFPHLKHEPFVVIFVDQPYTGHRLLRQLYPTSAELRDSPFLGVFNPQDNLILATVSAGYGTFLHELMHAMLHADFMDIPQWLDEAMASLYERSQWNNGALIPLPNWRLDNTQHSQLIDLNVFKAIEDDNVIDYQELSALRMLMLYLQSKGQLMSFYQSIKSSSELRSASNAIESLAIETLDWQRFVEQNISNYLADISKNSFQPVNSDEIRFIQSSLNKILATDYVVDGLWGSSTLRQVKTFQTQQGLGVDGVVGKNTLKKIKRVLATME